MSQISLIPAELKKNIQIKRKKISNVVLAVLLIIILLLGYSFAYFLHLSYLRELTKLEAEKSYLDTKVKNKEEYYNAYKSVQKYESLVEKAKNDSLNWDIILTIFSQTIPQGIWFDSINLVYDGKTATCNIKGKAKDKIVVIQWLADVEETGVIKNTTFEYITSSIGDETQEQVVEYAINMDVDIASIKDE